MLVKTIITIQNNNTDTVTLHGIQTCCQSSEDCRSIELLNDNCQAKLDRNRIQYSDLIFISMVDYIDAAIAEIDGQSYNCTPVSEVVCRKNYCVLQFWREALFTSVGKSKPRVPSVRPFVRSSFGK